MVLPTRHESAPVGSAPTPPPGASCAPTRAPSREDGFTLIEILVVVAILAIVARIVVSNLGALIPEYTLDAEAAKIANRIEYLRSEAQLQGKVYTFEFDLDNHRWRLILPPEEQTVSTQHVGESVPLGWDYLDDRVRFGAFQTRSHTALSKVSKLVIDENGYTAEAMIQLRMRNEADDAYVWTLHVRGLERSVDRMSNMDGVEPRLVEMTEAHFR